MSVAILYTEETLVTIPCLPGGKNLCTSWTGGIEEVEVQSPAGGTERTVQRGVGHRVVPGAGHRVVLLQGQAGLGGARPGCWHDWLAQITGRAVCTGDSQAQTGRERESYYTALHYVPHTTTHLTLGQAQASGITA